MQPNISRKWLVFKMNAFELLALNSPYYGANTWHRQRRSTDLQGPQTTDFTTGHAYQLCLCQNTEKVG